MSMRNFIGTCLALVFLSGPVSSQEKSVQYTRDFEFKEGIYLTFPDFKGNRPIEVSRIVSKYDKTNREFISNLLSKSSFVYIDSAGKEQEVKTEGIWGYCKNGAVHLRYGAEFNRITVIGSISHFVASVQKQVDVSDPFMYNDPFYQPQRYVYVTGQFTLDFETGAIADFTVPGMEALLSRDEELFRQFSALKKRQKRDSIFIFLRKYNERHPIYFPV